MGVGKYLKEQKPGIKIIGVEPTKGHAIQGLKNMEESLVPKIYHPELLDEKITIEDTAYIIKNKKVLLFPNFFAALGMFLISDKKRTEA